MTGPPGFDRITSTVFLHRADSPTSLLILSTWMGASPRLVNKYIKEFLTRFPATSILLVLSDAKSLFLPFLSNPSQLYSAAIDVVLQAQQAFLPLFAVTYSNGGCHTLCNLAKVFKARTGQPLVIASHVFDSAPGSNDPTSARLALTSSLPETIQRNAFLASMAGLIVASFIWLYGAICNSLNVLDPITRLRMDINDRKLFGPTKSGPQTRTYIYSDTDLVCPAAATESSAADAGRRGWVVEMELVKGSRHVAHAAVDPERYWSTIERALKV
jgi:hypothetical protein